ncbi:MAG TPA: AraC family transcriptional regulator [Chthoniobacteraceae bacterium]|nr:AraC family transcriptional regulator [Chthoniobacteraceae bacterium]
MLPSHSSPPPRFDLRGLKLKQISLYQQEAGRHPGGHTIPPYHERIELVTAGGGAILDGDRWRPITPGDLIWNQPGDRTIGQSTFDDPYRCLAITLLTPCRDGLGMPRFTRWPDLEEVQSFCRETLAAFVRESFAPGVLCDYIVSSLRFRMEQHRQSADALPRPLQMALQWLRDHYAQPCGIDELSEAVGWSPAYLFASFARHLKTTPHQYLIRERLRAARIRLVSTSQPIKQIAVECGFSDASAFSNRFKAEVGLTPKTYRLRNRSFDMLAPH